MEPIARTITVFAVLLPRSGFDYSDPVVLASVVLGTFGFVIAVIAILRSARVTEDEDVRVAAWRDVRQRHPRPAAPLDARSYSTAAPVEERRAHHGHV